MLIAPIISLLGGLRGLRSALILGARSGLDGHELHMIYFPRQEGMYFGAYLTYGERSGTLNDT